MICHSLKLLHYPHFFYSTKGRIPPYALPMDTSLSFTVPEDIIKRIQDNLPEQFKAFSKNAKSSGLTVHTKSASTTLPLPLPIFQRKPPPRRKNDPKNEAQRQAYFKEMNPRLEQYWRDYQLTLRQYFIKHVLMKPSVKLREALAKKIRRIEREGVMYRKLFYMHYLMHQEAQYLTSEEQRIRQIYLELLDQRRTRNRLRGKLRLAFATRSHLISRRKQLLHLCRERTKSILGEPAFTECQDHELLSNLWNPLTEEKQHFETKTIENGAVNDCWVDVEKQSTQDVIRNTIFPPEFPITQSEIVAAIDWAIAHPRQSYYNHTVDSFEKYKHALAKKRKEVNETNIHYPPVPNVPSELFPNGILTLGRRSKREPVLSKLPSEHDE